MLKSLEDYIIEMENRAIKTEDENEEKLKIRPTTTISIPINDVWLQLQQKENDLMVAAELGKALLDQNEDLKRKLNSTIEEYCRQLEAVEQDRHQLKRKLANKESESEARLLEVQNDWLDIKKQLADRECQLKQWERDKAQLVSELNVQNSRLTARLKDATQKEQKLQQQLDTLRDQSTIDKSNLHQHLSSIDSLRTEFDLINEQNRNLERQYHQTLIERDHLRVTLDDAHSRIVTLEKQVQDHTNRRIYDTNRRFEVPMLTVPTVPITESRSLQAEIDQDLVVPNLIQECMSVYRQLRHLIEQLRTNQDNDDDDSGLHSSDEGSNTNSLQLIDPVDPVGLIRETAQELVNLILDTDVVRLIERLELMKRDCHERDVELQRRSDLILELRSKISVCEVELGAAVEDRDHYKFEANSSNALAHDELVQRARIERDTAIQRKTRAEIELAKTRVELMQAHSQLMEAIQQKVALSQQLEQWQMDMQELLDEQLKKQLTRQEQKMRLKNAIGSPPPPPPSAHRRLLKFFLR